jgi:hypothetical protein
MSVATLNASYPAAVSTNIDYAMLNQRIAQQKLAEAAMEREAQIAANIAERIDGVGTIETAANVAGLGTIALPTGALNEFQKGFVQNNIVATGNLSERFAGKLASQGLKEAGIDISSKAFMESAKAAGEEITKAQAKEMSKAAFKEATEAVMSATANNSVEQTAKGLGAKAAESARSELQKKFAGELTKESFSQTAKVATNEAVKEGIEEAVEKGVVEAGKASTLAKIAPHAGTAATAVIAVGGAAIEKHKSEQQLIGLYADDLKNKLGVDVKNAKVDDLKKLVETNPAEYDSLRQDLEKERFGAAVAGAGGSVAGGAAGTMVGTKVGLVLSGGAAIATGGAGAVATPAIVSTCAFVGGVAGSMVTSNGVQTWYKQCTGQVVETSIDALRKLEEKQARGEEVSALDVTKVIVGDDKKFEAAVQKLSGQNKRLHEMSPEMQVNLIMKEFPELHHASSFLAQEINAGREDAVVATKMNVQATINQGAEYAMGVAERHNQIKVENAASAVNIDYSSDVIEPQNAQIASRSQAANRSMGQGQGSWAATVSSNSEQSQLQQYAR